MVDITGKYLGNKRVEMQHLPSKSLIQTDAPVDNNGKGELFSPTDLVASGLGTCMLTVMGIYAEAREINLTGSHFHVKKIMTSNPRRIGEIKVNMHLPKNIDEETQEILKKVGDTCPVRYSINSEIIVETKYFFDV